MKAYAMTHVGKVRKGNEDAHYLPKEGENFAAVADGMGGHLAGEVASAMAIETFAAALRNKPLTTQLMRHALLEANALIFEEAKRDSEHKYGMGTTFTGLCFAEREAHVAHVGDSRAYLFRGGQLIKMTNDHTLMEEMIRHGWLTPEMAKTHPQRNMITQALGTAQSVKIDAKHVPLMSGDAWLLCSDGLTNYVTDFMIADILAQPLSYEEKLQQLIDAALTRGGGDNITCLIATDEGGEDT